MKEEEKIKGKSSFDWKINWLLVSTVETGAFYVSV
jgi:hypothetical protein